MDDPEKLFAEGVALYEKGDYRKAVAAFDRVIAIDPGSAEVWNNRGLAQVQTGQYREALQSINKALSLHPGYENALRAKKIVLGLLSESGNDGGLAGSGGAGADADGAGKKPSKKFVAAVLICMVIAVCGIVAFKNMQGQDGGPLIPIFATPTTVPVTTVPTPVPAPTPVPTPTPKQIPSSGIWVEINYSQYYSGSVGIPGNLQQLSGSLQSMPNTGDQFYQVPSTGKFVTASVKKNDGSGNPLTVNIYVDGSLVKTATTLLPYGNLDITAVVPAPTTPAPVNTTETSVPSVPAGEVIP